MTWATKAIVTLQKGETITIRPRGGSMRGKIKSGQEVTLKPITDQTNLQVNDIVLVTVKGRDYLHLIHQIKNERYLIGNNRGGINGWVTKEKIHGIKGN